MLIPGYYLIKPNSYLKERLKTLDIEPDRAELVLETVLWTHEEVSESQSRTGDDIAEVKLLFLANLMSGYLSGDLYSKILQSHQISLAVFDRWWAIERYFIEFGVDEIENNLQPDVISFFVKTGRERIDSWIEQLNHKIGPRR